MSNRPYAIAGVARSRSFIALAFLFTLPLAFATPAEAAKNLGGYQKSLEAKRVKFCGDLQSSYNFNVNYYNEKPKKRSRWKQTADNLKIIAQGNSCEWAE